MPDKTTSTRKPYGAKIPEETRQHYQSAREEFLKSMEGLFPPEFREHHRKARREMLLAWRSMIDASLGKMDEK
jgi:hypothetical protein